jgi:hypothetical protein
MHNATISRLTDPRFWLCWAIVLMPFAGGCFLNNRVGTGVGVGAYPVFAAGRSGLAGHLESRGVGAEAKVNFTEVSNVVDIEMTFKYLPAESSVSGEEADLYIVDMGLVYPFTLTHSGGRMDDSGRTDLGSFYWKYGVGVSGLFMDMDEQHDMGGGGLYGRLGIGTSRNRTFRAELYGDVHGWLGGDATGVEAAWATTVGISLMWVF